MSELFAKMAEALIAGKVDEVSNLTKEAVDGGLSPQDILEQGLLAGIYPTVDDVPENLKRIRQYFVCSPKVAQRVLGADAEADVKLRLRCEVGFDFQLVDYLPAVSVDPEVTHADLQLIRFRVRRISQIRGALAHELGKGLRELLERKWPETREDRAVA